MPFCLSTASYDVMGFYFTDIHATSKYRTKYPIPAIQGWLDMAVQVLSRWLSGAHVFTAPSSLSSFWEDQPMYVKECTQVSTSLFVNKEWTTQDQWTTKGAAFSVAPSHCIFGYEENPPPHECIHMHMHTQPIMCNCYLWVLWVKFQGTLNLMYWSSFSPNSSQKGDQESPKGGNNLPKITQIVCAQAETMIIISPLISD